MEEVFSKYGVAGVCVLLTLMALLKVAEILLAARKEKDSLSDSTMRTLTAAVQESTVATKHLDERLQQVERAVVEWPKVKTDLRRSFAAIKNMAGSDWPRIRDEIMKDDF